ncbi:ABC transporter permease [Streptomyces curacoi]|uniref:Uncharacterized protein n=1 Tax=Streptomyces curacoi TaxID=146536 RepID=A0A124H671_9ACTN|nr:ABC transporter permease [Streptomyces curacoi]KUM80072.1 hypothetical protein AQI70_07825 [Streptomyces curacoi]
MTAPVTHTEQDTGAPASPPPAPRVVPAGEAFRNACRYEWRHLAALRSTWVLLGVVAVLSLLTGPSLLLDLDRTRAIGAAQMGDVLAWSPMATQIPLLCFFVLILGTGPVSTDLVRGAARTTWLAVNGRRTAYAAKCAVGFLVGAGVAATSALVGAVSAAVVLAAAGAPQPAWAAVLLPVVRFVLWMGCWALLCTALVALLRNRITPVVLLCLWPVLGERLAGLLLGYVPGLDGVGDWLPFAVGRAMLTDVSAFAGDDKAFAEVMVGSDLPTLAALVVYLLYTAALTAAGYWAYCRREAPTG